MAPFLCLQFKGVSDTNCIRYLTRSEPPSFFNSKRIGKQMVVPF